jgi:putative Holliday junction resolvase
VEADDIMTEVGIRREDRKQYVDKIAAMIILQDYLNSLSLEPKGE